MKNKWVNTMVRTALLLALLVMFQGLTAGLGNQYVTGSLVNLVLAVSAMTVGLWGSLCVALISPFLAFLLGIGPKFLALIPGIALGNGVFVLLIFALFRQEPARVWQRILYVLGAASMKFLTLYLVIVKLLVPLLSQGGVIPQKAAGALGATFSYPQLITAAVGGCAAVALMPALRKAIKKEA